MAFLVETEAYPAEGVGLPDGTAPAPLGQVPGPTTFTLTDMAELVARLKSVNTFDRRGNVIWLDDFEGNIDKWATALVGGVGGSIATSVNRARNGSQSIRMTVGDVVGASATITKILPYPVVSNTGFEISFIYTANLNYEWFLYLYDGTNYSLARFRIQPATTILQIEDNVLGWVTIDAAFRPYAADRLFHTIKIVMNPTTGTYLRLIFDDVEYDISANELMVALSAVRPSIGLIMQLTNRIGANVTIYNDDAIFTQNEPENVII